MRFLILSLAIGALIFTFPTGHFFWKVGGGPLSLNQKLLLHKNYL
jgi:hypothetical protein